MRSTRRADRHDRPRPRGARRRPSGRSRATIRHAHACVATTGSVDDARASGGRRHRAVDRRRAVPSGSRSACRPSPGSTTTDRRPRSAAAPLDDRTCDRTPPGRAVEPRDAVVADDEHSRPCRIDVHPDHGMPRRDDGAHARSTVEARRSASSARASARSARPRARARSRARDRCSESRTARSRRAGRSAPSAPGRAPGSAARTRRPRAPSLPRGRRARRKRERRAAGAAAARRRCARATARSASWRLFHPSTAPARTSWKISQRPASSVRRIRWSARTPTTPRTSSSVHCANCARSDVSCAIFMPEGVTRCSKSNAATSRCPGVSASIARSRWSATTCPAPPSPASVEARSVVEPLERSTSHSRCITSCRYGASMPGARPFASGMPDRRGRARCARRRRRRARRRPARPRSSRHPPRARSSARAASRSPRAPRRGRAGRAAGRSPNRPGIAPFSRSSEASVSSRSESRTLTRSGPSTSAASASSNPSLPAVVGEVLLRLVEHEVDVAVGLCTRRRRRRAGRPRCPPPPRASPRAPARAARSNARRRRPAAPREAGAARARRSRGAATTSRPRSGRRARSAATR